MFEGGEIHVVALTSGYAATLPMVSLDDDLPPPYPSARTNIFDSNIKYEKHRILQDIPENVSTKHRNVNK